MPKIGEWIKRLHEDKAFAEKFKDVDNQQEIIALARKNGYEITEQDLNDLKMEAASGGSVTGVIAAGSAAIGLLKTAYENRKALGEAGKFVGKGVVKGGKAVGKFFKSLF